VRKNEKTVNKQGGKDQRKDKTVRRNREEGYQGKATDLVLSEAERSEPSLIRLVPSTEAPQDTFIQDDSCPAAPITRPLLTAAIPGGRPLSCLSAETP
jgi:hypothetical protein